MCVLRRTSQGTWYVRWEPTLAKWLICLKLIQQVSTSFTIFNHHRPPPSLCLFVTSIQIQAQILSKVNAMIHITQCFHWQQIPKQNSRIHLNSNSKTMSNQNSKAFSKQIETWKLDINLKSFNCHFIDIGKIIMCSFV